MLNYRHLAIMAYCEKFPDTIALGKCVKFITQNAITTNRSRADTPSVNESTSIKQLINRITSLKTESPYTTYVFMPKYLL